jgi:hypothetical protein
MEMNHMNTTAIQFTRGRLTTDIRGAHVTMAYKGRTLLGEVRAVFYQEHGCSGYRLRVSFFNGEQWPIEPFCSAVRVLVRDTR